MQIAILGFSIIGAVTGTASLLIMVKTAKELQGVKTQVETEVADVKRKVKRNAQVIQGALSHMEF